MSGLTWHEKPNDAIRGDKIIVIARKIGKKELVPDSSAHRANRVIAKNNARAWVDTPVRAGPQFNLGE